MQIFEGVTAIKKLSKLEIPRIPGNFENSPNSWKPEKFPKCLGIWEIPQMSRNKGNSPNTWESRKFPKYLGIWGIPQIFFNLFSFPVLEWVISFCPLYYLEFLVKYLFLHISIYINTCLPFLIPKCLLAESLLNYKYFY